MAEGNDGWATAELECLYGEGRVFFVTGAVKGFTRFGRSASGRERFKVGVVNDLEAGEKFRGKLGRVFHPISPPPELNVASLATTLTHNHYLFYTTGLRPRLGILMPSSYTHN